MQILLTAHKWQWIVRRKECSNSICALCFESSQSPVLQKCKAEEFSSPPRFSDHHCALPDEAPRNSQVEAETSAFQRRWRREEGSQRESFLMFLKITPVKTSHSRLFTKENKIEIQPCHYSRAYWKMEKVTLMCSIVQRAGTLSRITCSKAVQDSRTCLWCVSNFFGNWRLPKKVEDQDKISNEINMEVYVC